LGVGGGLGGSSRSRAGLTVTTKDNASSRLIPGILSQLKVLSRRPFTESMATPFEEILRAAMRDQARAGRTQSRSSHARWDSAAFRFDRSNSPTTRAPACFALLGIHDGSTVEDVRRAFRRLAFELHPDRGGSHERFVELADAYRQALKLAA
jgi:hypothetical protein